MDLLRRRWIALLGGVLLVTLTVSSAFGADPTDESDDPRGQTIAAFVHSLIFDTEEPPDEEPTEEEDLDQDEAPDTELDEEGTPEADGVDGAAHGECVSDVARDEDAVGGPNDNHGGAVSEAARETCWDEPAPEEDAIEPEVEEDSQGGCVAEVARDKEARGGPNDNHGGAVSEAARETCREDSGEDLSEVEAAETEEADGTGNGNGRGGGNGNGRGNRGGGRP
jgi:hypothetical protein